MAPLRGWAPKGKRLRAFAPHGHWRTLTFLGALRCDQLTAGDIVILDNLGSHKSAELRRMLKAVGARLWYLPPYSPDLNPIEQTFAKIKHWMRNAQKRTIADHCRRLGEIVRHIQPTECQNYFVNAGYAST